MKFITLFLFAIFALMAGSFASPVADEEAKAEVAEHREKRQYRQEWCVP